MAPASMMMKMAGPSPVSMKAYSNPQVSQRGRKERKPAKSLPWPQRGHLQHSPRDRLCGSVGACGGRWADGSMRSIYHERADAPKIDHARIVTGKPVKQKGRPRGRPFQTTEVKLLGADKPAAAGAPHINAGKQKQPHHVNEVPVPGGKLEAKMLGRREMTGIDAHQAYDQKDGADQDMETVEAGRHEEGGAIDVAGKAERGVAIFISLHAGEACAENDGQDQTVFQALPVILQQRMMRPGHRGARGQKQ